MEKGKASKVLGREIIQIWIPNYTASLKWLLLLMGIRARNGFFLLFLAGKRQEFYTEPGGCKLFRGT